MPAQQHAHRLPAALRAPPPKYMRKPRRLRRDGAVAGSGAGLGGVRHAFVSVGPVLVSVVVVRSRVREERGRTGIS